MPCERPSNGCRRAVERCCSRAVVKPGVKNSNYRVSRRNRIAPRRPVAVNLPALRHGEGQRPHPGHPQRRGYRGRRRRAAEPVRRVTNAARSLRLLDHAGHRPPCWRPPLPDGDTILVDMTRRAPNPRPGSSFWTTGRGSSPSGSNMSRTASRRPPPAGAARATPPRPRRCRGGSDAPSSAGAAVRAVKPSGGIMNNATSSPAADRSRQPEWEKPGEWLKARARAAIRPGWRSGRGSGSGTGPRRRR